MSSSFIKSKLGGLKNPVARQSAMLYFSNLFTAGIGFIVSVVVARHLGPNEFAVVAAFNSIAITLAGFTDFGLGTGLIKFASPHVKTNVKQALPYLRFVLYAEFLIAGILIIIGILLTSEVRAFLGGTLSDDTVRLAIILAGITSLTAYTSAVFSAYKLFFRYALISIITGLLRIIALGFLLYSDSLDLQTIIFLYFGVSVFFALISFASIPRDFLKRVAHTHVGKAGKQIFRFSGLLTITFILNAIAGRLDFFYLYKIAGQTTAGTYAAAIQLSLVYVLFISSVTTALTPYVSEKSKNHQQLAFLKKALPIAFTLAFILAISALLMPSVVHLVFGAKYDPAIAPLQILILRSALDTCLIPVSLLFIPLGRVGFGVIVSSAQLLLSLALYPILINRFGATGAALTILTMTVLGVVMFSAYLMYVIKTMRKTNAAT